jgi:hypothetical protein
MKAKFPCPLPESPEQLAACLGWTEEVSRDLPALQRGEMTHEALDQKYLYRRRSWRRT